MAGEGIGITSRAAQVTLAHWAKKVSNQATQRYIPQGILQKKGKVKRGMHGGEVRWPVQYKQHNLVPHIDAQAQTYDRFNELTNANLRWAGLETVDAITHHEKVENGGEEAVVKIFSKRSQVMADDALQQFGKKFFVDGDSADREFFGIESMMAIGAQTATDELATSLSDTYAGISTSYTSFKSGAVKGTDEEYGVWSPVIVNTNRQDSGGNTLEWSSFADEYMRLGLIEACYGAGPEDMIDLILLKKSSFRQFLNILDDKERTVLVSGSEAGVAYGFDQKRFVPFDGCSVGWDFGVPETDAQSGTDNVHGYGFNTDRFWLYLLDESGGKGDSIFSVVTSKDPWRLADLIRLICLGQFKFESPRHFMKLADIS